MKKWNHDSINEKIFLIIKILIVSTAVFLFSGCSNDTVKFLEAEMEQEQREQEKEQSYGQEQKNDKEQEVAMLTPDAVQDTDNSQIGNVQEVQKVYVYVCGAVKNPGVYEMSADSRVFQAVEQAGGVLAEAAEGYVNLAMTVTDGQQIYIPRQSEISGQDNLSAQSGINPAGMDFSDGAAEQSDKVNINTADKDELMTISGIGESRAQDIIAYRESHGRFSAVEEIMNVPGIKEATFEKIKDGIEVK